jgi:hypothetical protein
MIKTQDTWIPGSEICGRLRELTGDTGPGWRKLLTMAADGRLPMMERRDGRFWGVYARNLPDLADALGISAKSPASV